RMSGRNLSRWNRAADFAINLLLRDAGFSLWDGALVNPDYRGWSAEQVYAKLPPEPEDGDGGQGGQQAQDGDQGKPSKRPQPDFLPPPPPQPQPQAQPPHCGLPGAPSQQPGQQPGQKPGQGKPDPNAQQPQPGQPGQAPGAGQPQPGQPQGQAQGGAPQP